MSVQYVTVDFFKRFIFTWSHVYVHCTVCNYSKFDYIKFFWKTNCNAFIVRLVAARVFVLSILYYISILHQTICVVWLLSFVDFQCTLQLHNFVFSMRLKLIHKYLLSMQYGQKIEVYRLLNYFCLPLPNFHPPPPPVVARWLCCKVW